MPGNGNKIIVYQSERDQLIDEWLMNGGYQTIGWLCVGFLVVVAIGAYLTKNRR